MDTITNRCHECKYFKFHKSPKLGWKDRYDFVKTKHPTLSEDEIKTLVDNHSLFEQDQSDWGKCGNKNLPELRDVEFNSKTFGCVYFKKK
jgi:hypothetical protein